MIFSCARKHGVKIIDEMVLKEARRKWIVNTSKGNMGYESISRDAQDTTQQFVPFSFTVKLPPLRKARLIIERNKVGQVVEARAPFVRRRQFKGVKYK